MKSKYDVVILGAGHNGLVAAAYLARSGLSVLLLEKNDYIGGATTSQKVFPDYDAHLSRYSYLVSLFPQKIIDDLGLDLELRRREIASYTPHARNGRHGGLLLSNISEAQSRRSLLELTGSEADFEAMKRFYALSKTFAEHVWPTMLRPLRGKDEFEQRIATSEHGREAWRSLVEEPIGHAIERYVQDDLIRGLVMTDGKIGVFTHAHDPSLLQNRCFLYHLIGNKTGEWKVPVGGMGNVAGQLELASRKQGADIVTNIDIKSLDLSRECRTVNFELDGKAQSVEARFLLVNFGLNVLARILGQTYQPDATDEGSVFKINMLLHRLPRLKDQANSGRDAFSGTFHIDESYAQMEESYRQAAEGQLPDRVPSEIYCHTLTDDSILSPELRAKGFHTLTLFGVDSPYSLFSQNNDEMRERAQAAFVAGLDRWLDEPLADCLARAGDGSPCIEGKSPVDIEEALGLYHGNIFQTALTFPFAETKEQAGQWGVETAYENVYLCGSSASRGGAVSGIPGHNAAMKVLEEMGR
ncbi:MAG: NAD(P)/FAD-dependent oxidoreductase [Blastocatellia bacterium]|nr:NAD(P)/FAD-dependent oxidoreductase [Blastocatellia bacterium]